MTKILSAIILMAFLFACKEEEPPMVTAIKLDVNELELKVGDTYNFKVTHNPPEARTPLYIWEVSKYTNFWEGIFIDVATIDQDGNFKAIAVGETYVTVTAADIQDPTTGKRLTETCKVTIKPIETNGLKLNKTELTLDPGDTEILSCSVIPENATNKSLFWTTSNVNIVTVTQKESASGECELKAVGAGEATITVYSNADSNIKATCKVKVNPAKLEGLSLNEKEKTVIQGESFRLTPVFTPEYATNKNVKWSSSDENIANVDNNGKVTTVHFGECTIKAIADDGGFEAKCKVTVKPVPLQNIKFDAYSYNLEIGGTKQLKVTYIPENAGNKKIKWSSSNSIVATVDENGIVKGNTQGRTEITAISEDGGHIATCSINVVEVTQMMLVYFPSAAVSIINGFYTGTISCAIRNNSSQSVRLTKFYVIDTNTFKTVAETTDESLLGTELAPGQTVALSGRFNSVYEPAFRWEMEYQGRKFTTYTKYGDERNLKSSEVVESKGKSPNMIKLYKE